MEMQRHESSLVSILLVDDDPCTLNLLTTIISKKFQHIKLFTSNNGEDGLELFKINRQNIVITDISLPNIDGIQLATEIKQLNSMTQIAIISGHNEKEYQAELEQAGIIDYIQKPINFDQLFTVISDYINIRKAQLI
jgi:YesN/AraC family two-component response regulator